MEGTTNRATDWTRSTTASLKFGLSLSAILLTSACGARPVHFTPPNRADPIMEVNKTIEPNAGEKLRIRNKISELSDRRSNLIQIYAVPGYQSSTDEGLNPTSDGATQTHVNE